MTAREPSGPAELKGRRVTVVGLGRFGGGVGAARWLCEQGAVVTVTDAASADALADSVAQLADCDVTYHLGGHEEGDFTEADLLVINPAVPMDMPELQAAAGVQQTTEINLFLERCRAPIVGITGSVGKSTTTAMIGEILSRSRTTHVGGNIGRSLLADLDSIEPDHVVVLELSSFQLERLPLVGISPQVAVVTNLQPNHLDRHGDMAAYAAAKKNIFAFQHADDLLILNRADVALATWADETPGRADWFDPTDEPFELIVPGAHNQANAQAAWSAACPFGVTRSDAAEALKKFTGLPHRLQVIADRDGVRYVNDSKCTTPGGAIVALEAFEARQCVVIVGGYDKGVSFDELGKSLADRAKGVLAIGATAGQILGALAQHRQGVSPLAQHAGDLGSAVEAARSMTEPGDVILLSPACASYDQFDNYEQRGDAFVELVRSI
jgi:UDP-N-acetylmuramoylalanine--D-glutamate ligase